MVKKKRELSKHEWQTLVLMRAGLHTEEAMQKYEKAMRKALERRQMTELEAVYWVTAIICVTLGFLLGFFAGIWANNKRWINLLEGTDFDFSEDWNNGETGKRKGQIEMSKEPAFVEVMRDMLRMEGYSETFIDYMIELILSGKALDTYAKALARTIPRKGAKRVTR